MVACIQHRWIHGGGKKPLGASRHKWEDNIEMDLEEIRCEDVDWFYPANDEVQWHAF
jgi:hypothetical protein